MADDPSTPHSATIPTRSYFSSHALSSSQSHPVVSPTQQSVSHTYRELSYYSKKDDESDDDSDIEPPSSNIFNLQTDDNPAHDYKSSYTDTRKHEIFKLRVPRPGVPDAQIDSDSDVEVHEHSRLLNIPTNDNTCSSYSSVFGYIPAVFLGLILNLLDAMSYGILIFPRSENIPDTSMHAGIGMFFASCVVSQLLFATKSGFKGAVGSMMIEIVPFLHIMFRTVESRLITTPDHILPTIMVVYALGTLCTGILFLSLGALKLGNALQFFPRHILVGCIGGIGVFLLLTGFEITTGIQPSLDPQVLTTLLSSKYLMLWSIPLSLAFLLKIMQKRIHHALFVPLFYTILPLLFYLIVILTRTSLDDLRQSGWLFELPENDHVPFYTFWTFYDFGKVDIPSVFSMTIHKSLKQLGCFPTIMALTFFGILHVPINVPALAISTQQDVNINNELKNHGYSNLLSGITGSCQNYLGICNPILVHMLVYSNSVLVYRSGGNSRVFGLLLAAATAFIWIFGGGIIGYVPKVVVGALIFHLGIDLLKESVIDTWNVGMLHLEYLTVITIIVVMGTVGFTEGILVGVGMACVFFGRNIALLLTSVFMYSQRSVIRATYSGQDFRSSVHRLRKQQKFLEAVGSQIQIFKLQGFMFFGTINQLDETIHQTLNNSIGLKYLVLDFSLINGIDYSATESFQRIKRMIKDKHCFLLFCGVKQFILDVLVRAGIFGDEEIVFQADEESPSRSSSVFHDENVFLFGSLNDAMEWCENSLLLIYYRRRNRHDDHHSTSLETVAHFVEMIPQTPREQHVNAVASRISHENERKSRIIKHFDLPREIVESVLLEAFLEISDDETTSGSTSELSEEDIVIICKLFQKIQVEADTILWDVQEKPTELYIVENGELDVLVRSNSEFNVVETLLRGTMVGELEMFSGTWRSSRLVSPVSSTLWKLDLKSYESLILENPSVGIKFTRFALVFDSMRQRVSQSYYSKLL